MSVTAPDRPTGLRELTIRGVILGGVITLVFTAANVYLGLKVGLTFATAIPAAVISMAVLRSFANHSIVENNIVQTIASAAGTLSAIIFVIPGLVMVGYWTGFPYWITVAVCLVGGILGVMYSIPLRRALVTGSDLPYPEGVAAAEVLKVGNTDEGGRRNRIGLRAITIGGITSAIFALLGNLKLISTDVSTAFRVGSGGTMIGAGLQLSLIGIGHLVGLSVGIAMFVGVIISYGIILPIKSAGQFAANSDVADVVGTVFKDDVRFVGAGAIAVAAVWTLLKLIAPIVKGIIDAMASARARREGVTVDITERDIPFPIVGGTIVVMLLPIGLLLWDFVHGTALSGSAGGIIAATVLFIFVIGMVIAAVCGYMAGLIGSSNSPISGVGILAVIIAALLIKFVYGAADPQQSTVLVAFTLFATAIVFGVATISNDNLQDLKTGQLVGATPWKQQVALIIGVCFGSLVIPADPRRHEHRVRIRRRAGGWSRRIARPAGKSDLRTGQGRVRERPQLEHARHRRGDRCRGHRHRRTQWPGEQEGCASPSRCRHGDVPTDVGHLDDHSGRHSRPHLQQVVRTRRRRRRTEEADRRTRRDGTHRRRSALERRLCGHRRVDG